MLQPDNMQIFITLHIFKCIYFINMNLKHTHTQIYTQKKHSVIRLLPFECLKISQCCGMVSEPESTPVTKKTV